MDIKYINGNYQFLYRVSAIILNKEENKILLFNVKERNFYLLPGGKVNEKETSLNAIKRELIEELDFSDLSFELKAISEEFVNDKNIFNQQINLIYKTIYKEEINNNIIESKEGDWCFFEWININDIDNINVYPKNIKEILNTDNINHILIDLTK